MVVALASPINEHKNNCADHSEIFGEESVSSGSPGDVFPDDYSTTIELIPEREDAHPDSPLEDAVSSTLKRENSIRRSQRKGRWGVTEQCCWD